MKGTLRFPWAAQEACFPQRLLKHFIIVIVYKWSFLEHHLTEKKWRESLSFHGQHFILHLIWPSPCLCITITNVLVGEIFFFCIREKDMFSNIYHDADRLFNCSKPHTSLRKQVSGCLAFKEEGWWHFLWFNSLTDSFTITHLFI